MRMIVVHVDREASQPIWTELLGLPLRSLSLSQVSCPEPDEIVMRYRGATLTQRLRPEVKLECITGLHHVPAIIDTVHRHSRAHAVGERGVYVTALEEAYRVPVGASSGANASGPPAQPIPVPPHEVTVDADLVAAG